jgi:hypothetical protein
MERDHEEIVGKKARRTTIPKAKLAVRAASTYHQDFRFQSNPNVVL